MGLGTHLQDDLQRFRGRVFIAIAVASTCFVLLMVRLFYLQVVRYEEYQSQAESNRTAIVPIVPNRGVITDRNGIVLATNYSAYTIEITPSRLQAPLETVIDQLAEVIDIQPRDRRRFKKLREESKNFESVDRKSTRLNSSHTDISRMPSSA